VKAFNKEPLIRTGYPKRAFASRLPMIMSTSFILGFSGGRGQYISGGFSIASSAQERRKKKKNED